MELLSDSRFIDWAFRFDQLAFRYVSYVAIPLLVGYTIYSLMYESYKGWYSFILTTLTSFVYMFGFVSSSLWSCLALAAVLLTKAHLSRYNWCHS